MTFENQPRNPAYIVIKHANGRWVVVETKPKAGRPHFQTRADAEAYAAMRNEMRAKEAPPVELWWGKNGSVWVVDDEGRLIGVCNNDHDRKLGAAAPEMLAALKMIAEWVDNPFDGNAPSINMMRKNINAAIAKAEGRS